MRLHYTLFIYSFTSCCLLLTAHFTSAQIIKGAVMAGFNISQVDGDQVYGFHKIGLNLGVAAITPIGKHFEFTLETIYNQKGSYQKPQLNDSLTGEYSLKLNYVEVPVLCHYNDKNDRISFGLGLSWGRLTSVKEYEHGYRITTTTLNNGPYSKNDFDALVDVRFRIWKRLKADVRYAYSFVKIRTREFHPPNVDPWTRYQYNNLWTLRLMYIFNEQLSERNKDAVPHR
jgi:hypothetical protein